MKKLMICFLAVILGGLITQSIAAEKVEPPSPESLVESFLGIPKM